MDIDKNLDEPQPPPDIIKPIQKGTIHRICSGQVVLNLAIAVKELIENAIDANATNIQVRVVEYGSTLIEVSDNGYGVRKENFEALALKHYTSKLTEFSDLESVCTLGFRGEALSSLCALSDLTILTRHESAEYGTKILYDQNGHITSQSVSPRQVGTTVTVANLFATLPVRRKEFLKNVKRDFNKMCNLLYAYCLVSKGIKFSCIHQMSSGSRNTIVNTLGGTSVQENIVCVFGAKQLSPLIEIKSSKPTETILEEYKIETFLEDQELPFILDGLISSCTHGNGRSTSDRQYYFINSRPCEPTKIMRLVNEIYRQFNNGQYPFVCLNILMKKNQVDVNITPDKRQVYVQNEKLLLATVKASLLETFKTIPSIFKMQNVNCQVKKAQEISKIIDDKEKRGMKRHLEDDVEKNIETKIVSQNKKSFQLQKSIKDFGKPELSESDSDIELEFERKDCSLIISMREEKIKCIAPNKVDINETFKSELSLSQKSRANIENVDKFLALKKKFVEIKQSKNAKHDDSDEELRKHEKEETAKRIDIKDESLEDKEETIIIFDSPVKKPEKMKSFSFNVTLEIIKDKHAKKLQIQNSQKNINSNLIFHSKIAPETNDKAEKELEKQFDKIFFEKMSIIGQFNRGFIIAKLNSDLFIIDQHATDEKYNFEMLQRTTVLETQRLVNSKPLQLTAAGENVVIDNEEIFKKNGFLFEINHEAEATKKVSLVGIPVSKSYAFGKDDIDEMIFMLQDSPQIMCRPTRVRSMFASRACRSSVMIGSVLSQADMKRLINHMGEIEHPWNCPHGRPTMRHLINLELLQQD